MGLDMYAYTTPIQPSSPVDFEIPELIDVRYVHEGTTLKLNSFVEISYWRKHYVLHDLMKKIYLYKGGADKDFNCANLQLTASDVIELENNIIQLHYDDSRWDYSSRREDLAFIEKAKAALQEGLTVYYYAWY